MPTLPRRRRAAPSPRIVVLGDLMLDVVIAPSRPLERGTDVPGTVALRQGGSAANTARWLARLGARTTLIAAVGRDPAGRALVDALRRDGVTVRAARVAGARTGRIGVVIEPGGERSFVADRGAADRLTPDDLDPAWISGADVVHLPAYSLLTEPLGQASRRAIDLGRAGGARISVDLASIGPLLARGRSAATALLEAVRADVLFATAEESGAMVGRRGIDGLLDLSGVAVVKRGAKGATVLATQDAGQRLRFEVATEHLAVTDTTGAGDAFDAGFLVGWQAALAAGRPTAGALHRGAVVGHRTATRHLMTGRPELDLA